MNSIGDREEELQAFKRIDLAVLASSCGFEVDRKETTRGTTIMRRGSEKIGISKKDGIWLFCVNREGGTGGTAIEFAQLYLEPGAHLGRVRQILRPYLSGSHMSTLKKEFRGKFTRVENTSASVDYQGIASRLASFDRIEGFNQYLCEDRSIPTSVLEHPRVKGRVRVSRKHGSVIFPHYGSADDNPKCVERAPNGYEIKGTGVNLFSKNGRKGLWTSAAFANDRILAVAESGVDALSYLALNDIDQTRIVSIGGNLNTFQPALLQSAIRKMREGTTVVSCVDNDPGGDKLNEQIDQLVSSCGCRVRFETHRPSKRNQDWNDTLRKEVHVQSKSIGRGHSL